MIEKLKLKVPIDINGETVNEIPYDFDVLTAKDKINVGKKFKAAGFTGSVQELDPDYHLFIFAEAVIKADKNITEQDVMRMSMKDTITASSLVRNYFFLDSEEFYRTITSEEESPK
ncbi:hypothetical protein OXPF_39370 [Oxobacter pfennigii]|uniref:Phage XkdN-like protein n=1 Tax=Oxobacter pfennigii TaxID=36849 RepID=A0A0P8YRF8_9CLOT|nr:hypothetical protein [Oxobacter pfennigii]KPU42158.1 hypothetical protein OXPF_39370 [Oxobacter pfennigii]